MNKIFGLEGPLFAFLSKLANLVIINLLWILCSLPIFTIGASTSAMLFSTIRITNYIDDNVATTYFKAFAKAFKKGTIIWLIMLLIGALFSFDAYFFYYAGFTGSKILFYVMMPVILFYIIVLIYVFGVLIIYDNSVKNAFRNAIFFAISNLPSTLFMMVGGAGVILLSTKSSAFFAKYGILFWLIVGFAFVSYIAAFFLNRAFKPSFEETEYEDILAMSEHQADIEKK